MPTRSPSRVDYSVACICPMGIELAPVLAMLDERHPPLPAKRTQNCYTLGRIGEHNLVVTTMPETGNNRAASVATQLMNDFPSVRFGLLVGVGGGVSDREGKLDIRLGDIVVSKPTATNSGVVQYDMGKFTPHEGFRRTGSLSKPPTVLLTAVESLKAEHSEGRSKMHEYLLKMGNRNSTYKYPGTEKDLLFQPTYSHRSAGTCRQCDRSKLVKRQNRSNNTPKIHHGTIGSGNAVVRDATKHEKLRKDGVICVEMEAAGLMDTFPCLVIRGICDYADSHKNKAWQAYAAAAAAAYMKDLLMIVPPHGVENELKVIDVVDVSQISEAIRMEKQSDMMAWLSRVNSWVKQDNILQRAQEGTGQWIFQNPNFASWLAGDFEFLWCHGESGAGKTILASIIIKHLIDLKKDNEALIWIYADYSECSKLTMENLFSSLLAQLFQQCGEISQSMVKSLGVSWREAKPTLAHYRSWLQEEVRKFNRTTVIIDALDELPNRDLRENFIHELRQLQPPIRLLVTSRPYLEIRRFFRDVTELEIRPQQEDVILFVKSRLIGSIGLREHIEQNSSLSELLIKTLSRANEKMFLKAELILNVLENTKTVEEVEAALKSLPSDYDGCYDFSLKQIEMQSPTLRDKAFRTLAWLSHAIEPLSVEALQQALSVQPGDLELDDDNQTPEDELLSVCHGLVIPETVEINEAPTRSFKLLHETASAYLKKVRSDYLPVGHEIILKACLAYMSLSHFSNLRIRQIKVDERAREYPFYNYAARNWPKHAIEGNLECSFQEQIIKFLETSHRHSADEVRARHRRSAWGCEYATPWTDWNKLSIERRDTPVHAAATYGLSKILSFLLDHKGYQKDTINNFGETPLHRAAQLGKIGPIDVLLARGADIAAKVNQHYLNDANLLILATNCCQPDAVRVFLNHGISVNTYDPKYGTFPLHLAASTDTKLTQLLLDYGAKIDFPGKSPSFPETFMTSLHFAVFNAHRFEGARERINLLLDRGANINMKSVATENTPLHMAILGGHEDLIVLLLQRGADIELRNKVGKSAVQLIRERGLFSSNRDCLPPETLIKLEQIPDLHYAVWSRNDARVFQLLEKGSDIEQKDQDGSTVWEYCVSGANVVLAEKLVNYMDEHQLPNRKEIGNTVFEAALKSMTMFDYTDHKTWEGAVKICQLLLKYRKEFDPNLEFAKARSPICEYNKTYLIWASVGRIPQVQFLLDCKADVNAADRFGNTALHYAASNRDDKMIEVLVENGADLQLKDQHGRTPLDVAEMANSQLIYNKLKLHDAKQLR